MSVRALWFANVTWKLVAPTASSIGTATASSSGRRPARPQFSSRTTSLKLMGRSGWQARTASTASRAKRRRFSRLPP